jgi:hypothetical protein
VEENKMQYTVLEFKGKYVGVVGIWQFEFLLRVGEKYFRLNKKINFVI